MGSSPRSLVRISSIAAVSVLLAAVAACSQSDESAESQPSSSLGEPAGAVVVVNTDNVDIPPEISIIDVDLGVVDDPDAIVMPLTGVEVESVADIPDRPAIVVKIPMDDPQAMPHSGINSADIVFQTVINDRISRLLAVFHSQGADPVGPVRSGRVQDVDIASAFQRPLVAYSGGNGGVLARMRTAESEGLIVDLGHSRRPGLYFRRNDRAPAPHNLFTTTDLIWSAAPEGAVPPLPVFDYLPSGDEPAGAEAASLDVSLDSVLSHWEFDPASGRYLKWNNGNPHMAEDGTQVWADNVVVMLVDYVPSPVDGRSPMMTSRGANQVLVFTNNTVRTGIWYRANPRGGWALMNNAVDQEPIGLAPGRTWVEMPRNQDGVVAYQAPG